MFQETLPTLKTLKALSNKTSQQDLSLNLLRREVNNQLLILNPAPQNLQQNQLVQENKNKHNKKEEKFRNQQEEMEEKHQS